MSKGISNFQIENALKNMEDGDIIISRCFSIKSYE